MSEGSAISEKEVTSIDEIRFICSRCKQILHLDPSFSGIDKRTFIDLITAAKQSNPETSAQSSVTSIIESQSEEKSIDDGPSEEGHCSGVAANQESSQTENESIMSASRNSTKPYTSNISFTMVGDVNNTSMDTFSHKLNTIIKLFDVISSNTSLDHPLCEECNDQVLNQLAKELAEAQSETDLYLKYCDDLKNNSPTPEELDSLGSELESLREEERELLARLEETENERDATKEQIKRMKIQRDKLKTEEKDFLKLNAESCAQRIEIDREQKTVENHLQNAESQLKRLRKTNVFNATFHIWHTGSFGTINGFRLGKLPNKPVEWDEINAAWGQTTLLLASLIKKIGLQLQKYRLVPFGNHSYIQTLENKPRDLPLYGSSRFRLLWDGKFDQGMIAFLHCLQQFKEELERSNKDLKLPYKMDNGKIEDPSGTGDAYQIKLQFNSDENWTKALKFMLTNLKWGLAWVSSEFPSTPSGSK